MNNIEIINLLAIVLGPILAVQIQKWLERQKENKQRKVEIFKTLMATRGNVLSHHHVEALNRIDLEFSDNDKYRSVISSWKEYFNNLHTKADSHEQLIVWTDKNVELLANLLFEMGKALGYSFDRALIKRNWYSPVAHGNIESENNLIRKGIIEVLEGNRTIPMDMIIINNNEDELKEQQEIRKLMIRYYKEKLKKKKYPHNQEKR